MTAVRETAVRETADPKFGMIWFFVEGLPNARAATRKLSRGRYVAYFWDDALSRWLPGAAFPRMRAAASHVRKVLRAESAQ